MPNNETKTAIIILDGEEVKTTAGRTILNAAADTGIYIPHLCFHKEMLPGGHCRVCTVKVNGRNTNSCTMTVADGMVVENNTPELNDMRRLIIELLFVEGNHICPFCEKSGTCELQALAYRLGMATPEFPYLFPQKKIDSTHPDVFLERNRCILCGRCIRASREIDNKYVFGFENRGIDKRITVDASTSLLRDTNLTANDRASTICPTGSLMLKRVGFNIPFGKRIYDHEPIGSDIEKNREDNKS
jgi:[NiFe] hydrogenase diaphorase moiety small subunit